VGERVFLAPIHRQESRETARSCRRIGRLRCQGAPGGQGEHLREAPLSASQPMFLSLRPLPPSVRKQSYSDSPGGWTVEDSLCASSRASVVRVTKKAFRMASALLVAKRQHRFLPPSAASTTAISRRLGGGGNEEPQSGETAYERDG